MKAGVPQGSVLGPLQFLNDIADDIQSLLRLFSDDSSLIFSYINPLEVEDRLNLDLQDLDNRAKQWLVDFRERPFNLKGWGGGMFFFLRYNLIPNVAVKNILILVEEKKSDSEFLSYKLMLDSGKKFGALRHKKNKCSNSRVVPKKF